MYVFNCRSITKLNLSFFLSLLFMYTLGQFYHIFFRANSALPLRDTVKSIIHLSFLDEPDRRVEFSHWQYWYDLQANPNQRSFDIGTCVCTVHNYSGQICFFGTAEHTNDSIVCSIVTAL